MKAIFLILIVLSLFAFSYSYAIKNDCKVGYIIDLRMCNEMSKLASLAYNLSLSNYTNDDSALQKCKKRVQEKLEQCLKNENNLNK